MEGSGFLGLPFLVYSLATVSSQQASEVIRLAGLTSRVLRFDLELSGFKFMVARLEYRVGNLDCNI